MLASELYAISQNAKCEGKEECHWCSAPCQQTWIHDDPLPIMGFKSISNAKRPANHFICAGCWLFRRQRLTVQFMDNGFLDRQCPLDHSWIINSTAKAIRPANYSSLYDLLLKPPQKFVLSFITSWPANSGQTDHVKGISNHLHIAIANDLAKEIKADTTLFFTINNIAHNYTIYDLNESLKNEEAGRSPGVAALMRLLGPINFPKPQKTGKGGRPFGHNTSRKIIEM